MSSLIGQSLGPYHILEPLGEGGMATVYKAYDARHEREVAIKIIRSEVFGPIVLQKIYRRFEREAQALAKLRHPNIVGVIEYGEFNGSPFLVMEYVSAGTLKQRLGIPIIWHDAFRTLLPITRALAYSHQQGIIHRDIKPSNILVDKTGTLLLSDFGIAKLLEGDDSNTLSTGTGIGIGTPEYMAPEQGMGHEVDARADIYSLGIVLYEMVTGRKPFTADTPMAVIVKHINDPLPRPKKYIVNLPDVIERILLNSLAKEPKARYPDMGGLAKAMEQALRSYQIQNKKQTTTNRSFSLGSLKKKTRNILKLMTDSTRAAISKIIEVTGSAFDYFLRIRVSVALVRMASITLISALMLSGLLWFARQPFFDNSFPHEHVESPTPLTIISTSDLANGPIPLHTTTPKSSHTPSPSATPSLGIGSTWTRPKDEMTMIYVPGGDFVMGNDSAVDDAKPAHRVYLDAFWIDRTEITNYMFAGCVSDGVCKNPGTSVRSSKGPNLPVVGLDWEDAQLYCSWAEVRLPTEAEWEKAARGVDGRVYPWGNTTGSDYYQNLPSTIPVGSYPKGISPYGALDMAGGALEWVSDWYSPTYYHESPSSNPQGPDKGDWHVLRGGWLFSGDSNVRSDFRNGLNTKYYFYYFSGFRCALSAGS